MASKTDKNFYVLVQVFVALALIGFVALLASNVNKADWTNTTFAVIAFFISVAALIMTTLQSLSIARQVRITQKAAQLVRETSRELEILVGEDKKMERELRQDIELDREIIAALEEHGVGDTEAERRAVAKTIQKKLNK